MKRVRISLVPTAALMLSAAWCNAATLSVTLLDRNALPVPDVAVVAVPANGDAGGVAPAPLQIVATMDQVNRQFDPGLLVVRKGTTVSFPNSDDVAHQVYSFSSPKRFELPLYRGQASMPVTFDQAGIVVLGCNIHDSMIGYVYVADSPYFGKTDARGRVDLPDLPAGVYRVSAWSSRFAEATPEIVQQVTIATGDVSAEFRLQRPLKGAPATAKPKKLRY